MPKHRSRHRPLRPVARMGDDTRSVNPAFYDTAGHPGHFDTYLSPPFKRYGPGLKADSTTQSGQLYISSPIYPAGSRTGHGGVDVVARAGVPLYAQANGKVLVATKGDYFTPAKLRKWGWPADYVRPGRAADDNPGAKGMAVQQAEHEAWMATPNADGLTGAQRVEAYDAVVEKWRAKGYTIPQSCGNYVQIEYDPNPAGVQYKVSYCHMRDALYSPGGFHVSRGERVSRGQLLGYVGGDPREMGAGHSTGNHLHITMRRKRPTDTSYSVVDPVPHIDWFPWAVSYRSYDGRNSENRIARPKGYSDEVALAQVQDISTARDAEVRLASHNTSRSGENLSSQPGRQPVSPAFFPDRTQVLTAGIGGGGRMGVIAALVFLPWLLGATSPERFLKDGDR